MIILIWPQHVHWNVLYFKMISVRLIGLICNALNVNTTYICSQAQSSWPKLTNVQNHPPDSLWTSDQTHTHTYTHTHIHTYIHTHTRTRTHRHTNCRLRWKKTDLKHLRLSKNKGHTTCLIYTWKGANSSKLPVSWRAPGVYWHFIIIWDQIFHFFLPETSPEIILYCVNKVTLYVLYKVWIIT